MRRSGRRVEWPPTGTASSRRPATAMVAGPPHTSTASNSRVSRAWAHEPTRSGPQAGVRWTQMTLTSAPRTRWSCRYRAAHPSTIVVAVSKNGYFYVLNAAAFGGQDGHLVRLKLTTGTDTGFNSMYIKAAPAVYRTAVGYLRGAHRGQRQPDVPEWGQRQAGGRRAHHAWKSLYGRHCLVRQPIRR